MSEPESHHHGKNEIIIVKRHGGHHGGHHGGAWKIAYADFMTAMMAFFLVMWLVNAANEKTKASIASYFNPVSVDRREAFRKGREEAGQGRQGRTGPGQVQGRRRADQDRRLGQDRRGCDATSGEETKYSDADFFENPYSVLSEIAKETGQQANISAKGEGGAQQSGPATGADGGEAYRDPFDPDFLDQADAGRKCIRLLRQLAGDTKGKEQAGQEQLAKADAAKPADGKDAAAAKALTAEEQKAVELKQAIDQALGGGLAGKLAEGLIVTPTEGGLLVSISEQTEAPMFTLGSGRAGTRHGRRHGEDRQDSCRASGRRRHSRPYRCASLQERHYDNWRLSSARAESAYYMLVRGGLDEKRVSQISGFADRRRRFPMIRSRRPNRRIEILLQDTQDKT